MPPELDALSSHTFLDGIGQVDIVAIVAMPTGIRVAGTGVVDVTLEYGAGESWDGVRTTTDFPFSFDMLLDHRLTVAEVYALKVDTARFYE